MEFNLNRIQYVILSILRKNKADSSGGGEDNSDKYSEDKTSAETTEGSESSGGESTE